MQNKIFLKKIPIFSDLSDKDLDKLHEITREATYKSGEVIFHVDDTGCVMFILKSGSVKISISDRKGHEDILKIIYPYDFFGEMSLLDGEHRSATVTALEKSTALIIERDHLIDMIRKFPQIALNMLAILSKRIRKTDERISNLRFADAYGKVAKVLLDIASEKGIAQENSIAFGVKICQQELADMAGITRETANRILAEFKKRGCINIEEGKITILNEGILKREAVC
ncbi:MAG: Crp/Fnr family transcriptional regulator [bacterium]